MCSDRARASPVQYRKATAAPSKLAEASQARRSPSSWVARLNASAPVAGQRSQAGGSHGGTRLTAPPPQPTADRSIPHRDCSPGRCTAQHLMSWSLRRVTSGSYSLVAAELEGGVLRGLGCA